MHFICKIHAFTLIQSTYLQCMLESYQCIEVRALRDSDRLWIEANKNIDNSDSLLLLLACRQQSQQLALGDKIQKSPLKRQSPNWESNQ